MIFTIRLPFLSYGISRAVPDCNSAAAALPLLAPIGIQRPGYLFAYKTVGYEC